MTKIEQIAAQVDDVRYIAYLRDLELKKKKVDGGKWELAAPWFNDYSADRYVEIYNEVASMGITIDGDCVALEKRGIALRPNFSYNAYKNLVLARYPDATFDFQVVYDGDSFSFRKDSGKVSYQHVIGNPFDDDKKVIGAYGVIKCAAGEFLELLNLVEIEKMRNAANTDNIWKLWYGEMVKKSIIKRICKSCFRDLVRDVEVVDNENYEPDNADFDYNLREEIRACTNLAEITAIYSREKGVYKDKNRLIALCAEQKRAIEVTPDSPKWEEVIARLQNGELLPDLRREYYISDANVESLTDTAL